MVESGGGSGVSDSQ